MHFAEAILFLVERLARVDGSGYRNRRYCRSADGSAWCLQSWRKRQYQHQRHEHITSDHDTGTVDSIDGHANHCSPDQPGNSQQHHAGNRDYSGNGRNSRRGRIEQRQHHAGNATAVRGQWIGHCFVNALQHSYSHS